LNKLTYSLANFGPIHLVIQFPYDWIFPKVYGVVHLGGSGTTHLALKYGCATMKNLKPRILELVNNGSFKKKAQYVSSQMQKKISKKKFKTQWSGNKLILTFT